MPPPGLDRVKNVYQPVEFMNILILKQQSILRLISIKIPEMEIFGFLEKFRMLHGFGAKAAENFSSMSRTFVTAWRSAMKLFLPTS